MKTKDYDDGLLVELLSQGDLTHTEIAERVGLSVQMVSAIANGKERTDLAPSLVAGLRTSLVEARRDLDRAHHGDPVRPRRRRLGRRNKFYDDNLLVELIATSEKTYKEIADEVGVSVSTVHSVANGRSRADLQDRIQDAATAHRREAHRLAARWLRSLVMRHITRGLGKDDDEPARRCREYIMTQFGGDTDKVLGLDEAAPAAAHPLDWMTDDDYAISAASTGGRANNGFDEAPEILDGDAVDPAEAIEPAAEAEPDKGD